MSSNYERRIRDLERRLAKAETSLFRPEGWRGAWNKAFTTTSLPKHGDYGYNTATGYLYMNVGGSIRRIATIV